MLQLAWELALGGTERGSKSVNPEETCQLHGGRFEGLNLRVSGVSHFSYLESSELTH